MMNNNFHTKLETILKIIFEGSEEIIEMRIAKYLNDIFNKAVNIKMETKQRFINCLKAATPDKQWNNNYFYLDDFGLDGSYVQFHSNFRKGVDAFCIYNNDKFVSMHFNISKFDETNNQVELQKALNDIEVDIYHECEHIFNTGYNPKRTDDEDEERIEMLKFFFHPGEMKSHARSFAYQYNKKYPGQKFDLSKMIKIADGIKNAWNYFIVLRKPEKIQKYSQYIPDLSEKLQSFDELTAKYVDDFLHNALTNLPS